MKEGLMVIYFLISISIPVFSQPGGSVKDSTTNNLVHSKEYKTSEYGSIPAYIKTGKGKQTLILIPGLGFDASVFDDFINVNKNSYTMYAVTIPGYGNTTAAPMPSPGTSYGEQSWNKGVVEGWIKLIEKEKLKKPVLVGHFAQGTQLALRMAIDHPEIAAGVIILGGPAKFISVINGEPKEFPLESTIAYVDKYTAPNWFQRISKASFDNGNYLPEVYSLDSATGAALWKQAAGAELPVMIRYLCEFFASDIKTELHKIKCPVLVLRPMFNDKVLQTTVNNYIKPQFIDSWEGANTKNSLIEVKDIHYAASFIWKDQPGEVYREIKNFLNRRKKGPREIK